MYGTQLLFAMSSKKSWGKQILSRQSQAEYRCRACGKQFEILGDLQTHILLEHHQKGDIPDEAEAA
ncbi:zinc finger C2H2 domain-containing protein [Candidatus Nitrososphaera gargensis Ga9.2]|uniref:Zinc finger C2H2 domain-containing protein n=1 Tax=Nitrososphaera gargensis (strain Ga9.2) TaxID=1237085 RepID=K0ID96_NITGG|nr:zinc finger C2H2 domain-containing protein [Candidatus Nitrososphaera gargensis Ga9.2]